MTLNPIPALLVGAVLTAAACGQRVDPLGRSILFIRGAFGTGGATEGGTPTQRTEQLSDIFNGTLARGNHSYNTLRLSLVNDGFSCDQLIESPTPLSLATLLPYRVVVMGSNNKVYSAAEVQAFHDYIDAGGSALFISDANWGLTWGAAPSSDNQFLGRYGAQVYQDSGQTPNMARATAGRYLLPDHPALSGWDEAGGLDDVNNYDGEGINLFRITTGSNGYQAIRVVSAAGLNVRTNTSTGNRGTARAADNQDAAMICVERGNSRILGHFDRNTFFNLNGAGTDITRLDNQLLALNLFRYLASVPTISAAVGTGCGPGSGPALSVSPPRVGTQVRFEVANASPQLPGLLVLAPGGNDPILFGNGCRTYVRLGVSQVVAAVLTDGAGTWSLTFPLPPGLRLSGTQATTQALLLRPGGPFLGDGDLTNGVELQVGYPR